MASGSKDSTGKPDQDWYDLPADKRSIVFDEHGNFIGQTVVYPAMEYNFIDVRPDIGAGVSVIFSRELSWLFDSKLTYNILRIDQGIDGLLFTIDCPCICDIPSKNRSLQGSIDIHLPSRVTWYNLFDDNNWIGMHLSSKEECEALVTDGRPITWTETTWRLRNG